VIYLGVYGSDSSRAAYAAVVADVLSDRPVTSPKRPDAPPATLTVREVCRRYTAFAERYYRRGDRPTTEASIVALACGRAAKLDAAQKRLDAEQKAAKAAAKRGGKRGG
jgi:hypothetical protein